MADRTVAVDLIARVTGFVSGMKTATTATQEFVSKGLDKVGKNEQHLRTLTTQAGILGLALTGLAVLAVKRFAEFDKEMSAVAATGEDAAASLNGLRDAALNAGRETAFSATEAAKGIEELLKAGVSAKDVLGGGLSGALNLAAAGELDVADAAEIAATAMTQFKLGGDQVNHVADLLASGASKAQGGVGDLGMALKQSGLVAKQTGLTIEETTAGLTAFASAGLIGSDAGTSFKSMLQRLTPQSKEAQKAMDDLGISAYDSQGNFVGLAKFAGILQGALKDLTPEQRNSALATIFGSDAVRAASVIYSEGESGIRDWIAAVDDQGFAAETAATRLDNLAGDIKILQGSIETALIGLGESADGPLRDLVQQVTGLVNAFAEAPDVVKAVTLSLIGGGGLVLLAGAGLGKLLITINDVKAAFVALKISAAGASLAAGGIAIAAVGIGLLVSRLADAAAKTEELRSSLDDVSGAATDVTRKIVAQGFAAKQAIVGIEIDGTSIREQAADIGIGLDELTAAAVNGGASLDDLNAKLATFSKETPQNSKMAKDLGVDWNDLRDRANAVRDAVNLQNDKLVEQGENVRDVADAADAAGTSQDDLASSTAETTGEITKQVDRLQDLIDAQAEAAGIVLSNREAQRQFRQSIDDASKALEENGASLDINTQKGRDNQAALDNIASAGIRVIDTMKQNGATQDELTGQMGATRDAFILAAGAFGLGADEANRLADEMGLIPDRIAPVVELNVAPARATLKNFLDGINNSSATIGLYARPGQNVAYANGGYTGDGGKYEPKGVVHGGEFVVDKEHTARWRPMLEQIQADKYVPGFSGGGYVPSAPTPSAGGVTFQVESIVASDANEAAERLQTKARDAIATYGLTALGVSS